MEHGKVAPGQTTPGASQRFMFRPRVSGESEQEYKVHEAAERKLWNQARRAGRMGAIRKRLAAVKAAC